MNNQPYELPDGHDPLGLAGYMTEEQQRHIIALGLIADSTAENEMTARSMVGVALGIKTLARIEALFLGDRIGSLTARMKALVELGPSDDDGRDQAFEWMKRAAKLAERRDDIIHRPVNLGIAEDDRVAQHLGRSRRSHRVEPLGDKGESLVRDLMTSVREGKHWLGYYIVAGTRRGEG